MNLFVCVLNRVICTILKAWDKSFVGRKVIIEEERKKENRKRERGQILLIVAIAFQMQCQRVAQAHCTLLKLKISFKNCKDSIQRIIFL